MSNAIRSVALAAALVGLAPMAAHAALVFKQVSAFSLVNDNTHKNGDPIASLGSGITVEGAEIFVLGNTPGDIGLTLLDDGDSSTNTIKIKFGSSVHVNALTVSRFSGSSIIVGVDGNKAQELTGTKGDWESVDLKRICSTTACSDEKLLTGDVNSFISELTFTQDATDFIGLNNLIFSVADTGNAAPEPASYGLAALALLAAGAATRRRNKA